MCDDPIQGGWIQLRGRQIEAIGSGSPPTPCEDLGDVALLPGLVNSHTHLEFSDLDQPIGPAGVALHDWIGMVTGARGDATPAQKTTAIAAGLAELRGAGTRLVGEITTTPCRYPRTDPELEWVAFGEVLGLSPERSQERLQAAREHVESGPTSAISPHAPYSTTPATIRQCVSVARQCTRAVAMHVAESPEERELLYRGGGPFADRLRAMGVWRDGLFPWQHDPFVDLIGWLAAAPRALLIHGNDLNDAEIAALQPHRHLSVVYCPRTHHFFQHAQHPVRQLLKAGVRVSLGTDSRASNPDLDVWRELQFLREHRTDLRPKDVLKMVTMHGADALGRNDLGRLTEGSAPGIGMVPTNADNAARMYDEIAESDYQRIG